MDFDYADGDQRCIGVLQLPDAAAFPGQRPGIVVAHEAWGLGDHVRRRAKMLADLGYVALAADTFGDRLIPADAPAAMQLIGQLAAAPDTLRPRIAAAVDALARHPRCDGRIGGIGYCFGGQTILELARSGHPQVLGVVSFHGALATARPAAASAVTARILVCHGDADPIVPHDHLTAFLDEMAAAGADCQTICYSGAAHGFSNPANDGTANPGVRYHAPTDARSWAAMQAHFRELFA